MEMMRLKARIYLWSEATDFKTFAAKNAGDGSPEGALVSLFRDLGANREPDPVLGLVANLSAAWDRLGEALKETTHFEAHPLVDNANREINAALAALQATPPPTWPAPAPRSRG
jgi:hypothetical protein